MKQMHSTNVVNVLTPPIVVQQQSPATTPCLHAVHPVEYKLSLALLITARYD